MAGVSFDPSLSAGRIIGTLYQLKGGAAGRSCAHRPIVIGGRRGLSQCAGIKFSAWFSD
jgi:hypothetical protein